MKVNKLKRDDPNFPRQLQLIEDSPSEIYYLGSKPSDWLDRPKLAVVGSRKATAYGRLVTESLTSELARLGMVIISGLALGIDSIAHQAALDAGGLTVAVLPTPLDKIYPASHTNLANKIIDNDGTLISEYHSGASVFKANFTARNRIVSGLSDGILVTEAAIHSGTLATVRYALEQGKVVMAVPGNINSPYSEGTNNLIKSGATLVTQANDVLLALNITPPKPKAQSRKFNGTQLEKKIIESIAAGSVSQEEMAVNLAVSGDELNAALTNLEINGYVAPAGGGNWNLS